MDSLKTLIALATMAMLYAEAINYVLGAITR